MKNYYELLEVHPNASAEIIEKAYKVLAKRYHPDSQSIDRSLWAETEFKKVSAAYSILSNPQTRVVYDYENGFAEKYKSLHPEISNTSAPTLEATPAPTPIASAPQEPGTLASDLKSGMKSMAQNIYNSAKSSTKEDRSKSIKALLLTIAIMTGLILIFWNIPFLRNLILP